jgi:hypothetical protein
MPAASAASSVSVAARNTAACRATSRTMIRS